MIRPQEIAKRQQAIGTLVKLTSVFEGIASLRIKNVKTEVQRATAFFNELWRIYTQIRVDSQFRFGRSQLAVPVVNKELIIVITAEGGFTGDIDQKLIDLMLQQYNRANQDVIVIGHHGAVQLAQNGIAFKKYFKLPEKDRNFNLLPLIKEVQLYKSTTVFYQTYVTLLIQDVKRIVLSNAVAELGKTAGASDEIISEKTYIFEPSTYDVVDHLEQSMLQIALSHVILESKLAQYASRFRAMSDAHSKADEQYSDSRAAFYRFSRAVKDERLKEIMNGLRKVTIK
jgi:ATP synthase F1 gamma subunit